MGRTKTSAGTPVKKGRTVATRSSTKLWEAILQDPEEETAYERLLHKVNEKKDDRKHKAETPMKVSVKKAAKNSQIKGKRGSSIEPDLLTVRQETVSAQFREDETIMSLQVK